MKKFLSLFGAIIVALAMISLSAPPATAAVTGTASVQASELRQGEPGGRVTLKQLSQAEIARALSDLESSTLQRTVRVRSGSREVTFTTAEGFSFTIAKASLTTKKRANRSFPGLISGGTNKYGTWIGFSSTDQSVLSSAVVSAAITLAICAIPAVGTAACAVVGVIVAIAVGYLTANGVCSGHRTLYVYTGSNRNLHAACANKAPYT